MARRALIPLWLGWWRGWTRPLSLGERGERAAAKFLRRIGYKIISRGGGRGELDVVAVDGRTLVFVEVKTRRGDDAGSPQAAVDLEKQRRITRAAARFLKRHELLDHSARFDVVAVTWPAEARRPTIEHFRAAFSAADAT
jgi:putative endonuclease